MSEHEHEYEFEIAESRDIKVGETVTLHRGEYMIQVPEGQYAQLSYFEVKGVENEEDMDNNLDGVGD